MKYQNLDLKLIDYEPAQDVVRFKVYESHSLQRDTRLSDAEEVTISNPREFQGKIRRLKNRQLKMEEMIDLGTELANLLFPDKVRQHLDGIRRGLGRENRLRIRLKPEFYALADIPWEYVYLPPPEEPEGYRKPEGFLVLDKRVSLARYEILDQPISSVNTPVATPVRMVALMAGRQTADGLDLQVKEERDNIREALKTLESTISLDEDFYAADADSLFDAFVRPAHIFHFSGHGIFKGDMASEYGKQVGQGYIELLDGEEVPGEFLATHLRASGLRLAVLNSCESGARDHENPWTGVVTALASADIPAVIGMQFRITDKNALAFSRQFYKSLAEGDSIDAAVAWGRSATYRRWKLSADAADNECDWGVPVLYLRTQDNEDYAPIPKAQSSAVGQFANPPGGVPTPSQVLHITFNVGSVAEAQVLAAAALQTPGLQLLTSYATSHATSHTSSLIQNTQAGQGTEFVQTLGQQPTTVANAAVAGVKRLET